MMQLLSALCETAARQPRKTAFLSRSESVSYDLLLRDVRRTASLLQKQGTAPVLLFGKKGAWMLTAMLACLWAGRAYVPLHARTPLLRLQTIAAQTGSDLLLSDLPNAAPGLPCCTLSELEAFAHQPTLAGSNDTAYIIFTSGSTGTPKGVPISRGNLDHFCGWISRLWPLCTLRDARILSTADFSFDLSVADLACAFCGGHTLVSFDSVHENVYDGLLPLLAQCDAAVMTPTCARLCLLDRGFAHTAFPKLQCLYFCGEPLEAATVNKLFGAFPDLAILNAYGPTEATSAVCAALITPAVAALGDPLPVGDLAEAATPITVEDGEIVLRGKSVFAGYLGAAPGGEKQCYRTGDRGEIRDGMLFCRGRKDRQIKYKGYRIELDDIEANLLALPGVRRCAVTAQRKSSGAVRAIHAFVEAPAHVTPDAVKAGLRQRLPTYMIPKTVRRMDVLPTNRNGKTDRKVLEK